MKIEKEKMCASGAGLCSSGCWCGKCIGWKLLKLFLCLAVAFFVFVCGVGVGVKICYYKTGGWDNGLGMVKYGRTEAVGPNTMFKYYNSKDGNCGFAVQSHDVRLFGSITKIEGNKITLLDNSAKEQVVLSQQATIIAEGDNEIGIASLDEGMNVVAVGAMNADNQMLAKIIQVQ